MKHISRKNLEKGLTFRVTFQNVEDVLIETAQEQVAVILFLQHISRVLHLRGPRIKLVNSRSHCFGNLHYLMNRKRTFRDSFFDFENCVPYAVAGNRILQSNKSSF
jgi:hypothetical protein